MKKIFLFAFLTLMLPILAKAQENTNTLLTSDKASWRRQETVVPAPQADVLPQIKGTLSKNALKNLTQSEEAFCYTVEEAGADDSSYVIDNMKITGFCGILSKAELDLFYNEFLSNEKNISTVVANCIIRPRIMLRFINGVDFSDVLLSSPCQSFTVFYAGEIKSFNLSPASEVVDAVVEAYEKRKIAFVSPALLRQILPIGMVQTQAERDLIKEKTTQKPVRNWQTNTQNEPSASQPTPKNNTQGWNRLRSE